MIIEGKTIKFDPDTLYSIDALREALHGIVELPTFLDRLGLRDGRVFKGALWGWEIMQAARKAKAFSEAGKANVAAVAEFMAGNARRGRMAGKPVNPAGRLSARDFVD